MEQHCISVPEHMTLCMWVAAEVRAVNVTALANVRSWSHPPRKVQTGLTRTHVTMSSQLSSICGVPIADAKA